MAFSYNEIIKIIRDSQSIEEVKQAAKRLGLKSPNTLVKLYEIVNSPYGNRTKERNKEIFNLMIKLAAQNEVTQLNEIYAKIAAQRLEQMILDEELAEQSESVVVDANDEAPAPEVKAEREQTLAQYLALQEQLTNKINDKMQEIELVDTEINESETQLITGLIDSHEPYDKEQIAFNKLVETINNQRTGSGDKPVNTKTTPHHDDTPTDRLLKDYDAVMANRQNRINEIQEKIKLLKAAGTLNSAESTIALTIFINQITLIEQVTDAQLAAIAERAKKIQAAADRVFPELASNKTDKVNTTSAEITSEEFDKKIKLMSLQELRDEYQKVKNDAGLDEAIRDERLNKITKERNELNGFFGVIDPNNEKQKQAVKSAKNEAELVATYINQTLLTRNPNAQSQGRNVAAHAQAQVQKQEQKQNIVSEFVQAISRLLDKKAKLASELDTLADAQADTGEKIREIRQAMPAISRTITNSTAQSQTNPTAQNNHEDTRPSLTARKI